MRVKRSNYDRIEGIKIIDEHGNSKLIRFPIKIENEVVNFYEHLFNGMNDKDLNQTDEPFTQDKDESFFLDDLGKMDNEDHAELEKDVTVDEIEEALNDLNKCKRPGHDGIVSEFYQETLPILKKQLTWIGHFHIYSAARQQYLTKAPLHPLCACADQ